MKFGELRSQQKDLKTPAPMGKMQVIEETEERVFPNHCHIRVRVAYLKPETDTPFKVSLTDKKPQDV